MKEEDRKELLDIYSNSNKTPAQVLDIHLRNKKIKDNQDFEEDYNRFVVRLIIFSVLLIATCCYFTIFILSRGG